MAKLQSLVPFVLFASLPALTWAVTPDMTIAPNTQGSADSATLPAHEQIDYEATWNGIPAGSIKQELNRTEPYRYRLQFTLKTNGFVSIFYSSDSLQKVDFEVMAKGLRVHKYNHVNQGSEPFPRNVVFNWDDNTAQVKNEERNYQIDLTPTTIDPMTLIQQLRFYPETAGERFTIVDGNSSKPIGIEILPRENMDTAFGKVVVNCYREFDDGGGVDKKKKKVTVCFTEDDRRIPVEIRFHAKYGDIVAKAVNLVRTP